MLTAALKIKTNQCLMLQILGSEGRREWEDRDRGNNREAEKRGGVIKGVMAGGDIVFFFPALHLLWCTMVKSALGERAGTGAGAWGHPLELELGNEARAVG